MKVFAASKLGSRLAPLSVFLALLINGVALDTGGNAASSSVAELGSPAEGRGDILLNAGDYMKAAQEYRQALKALGVDVEIFSPLKPGTLPYLKDPLRAAIVMRKWAQAIQLAGELRYARTGQLPKDTMLQAMFAASSSINVFEKLREWVPLEGGPRARRLAEELRQAYDIKVELSWLVSWDRRFVTQALKASNSARARSLFELVWARQTLLMSPRHRDEAANRRLSLQIRIGELSRSLLDERAESEPRAKVTDDFTRRLHTAQTELESLRPSSPQLSALLESGRAAGAVAGDLAGRSRLKVGEAVLQYHATNRFVFAFFVPEVGPLHMKLLRPNVQEFHSLVRSYALKLQNPLLPWKQTSTELYVELVSPFDHMIDNLKHLFIVPSGFLHQVPFSTLWDPRSKKLLADRVPSSVLQHMQLIGLTPKTKSPPTALVLGIRDFEQHDDLSLGEEEAIAVRDILGQSTTLLLGSKEEATGKQLLSELPRYRLVHLSTHAFPDRRPMLSRLIVKRQEGGDGAISALDLLELERPLSAHLVTLSACDTGQVRPGKGDDILGLSRAFLLAGSNAVVASLWPIRQESTMYLMKVFYETLKTGKTSISEALAYAQNRTATRAGMNWQHPFFWGATVVVGDGTIVPF